MSLRGSQRGVGRSAEPTSVRRVETLIQVFVSCRIRRHRSGGAGWRGDTGSAELPHSRSARNVGSAGRRISCGLDDLSGGTGAAGWSAEWAPGSVTLPDRRRGKTREGPDEAVGKPGPGLRDGDRVVAYRCFFRNSQAESSLNSCPPSNTTKRKLSLRPSLS